MCGQTLNAAGRRLSESRMRENLMSGSMWQGMKPRHGDGTEALSEEMESNGSATPKSRRHPLTLPVDLWDSAAFSSISLASGFFYTSNRIHARPQSANANRWANVKAVFMEGGAGLSPIEIYKVYEG